jgi:hypothetical protein
MKCCGTSTSKHFPLLYHSLFSWYSMASSPSSLTIHSGDRGDHQKQKTALHKATGALIFSGPGSKGTNSNLTALVPLALLV